MTEVKMQNLVKKYGNVKALDGVSLNLEPGTLTAVLGPSGCGKTTMLRSLGGFIKLDGGEIYFDSTEVSKLPPQDRGAALVFQNYALWPHMSVYDNIAYGLKLKKVSKSEIDKKVKDIVELVGLEHSMLEKGRKPTQLSGGQQQRVALARALVTEPSLFLLDEPLSNLDAKVRSKLRIYIREIQQKVGITTLYVTHDQEEALSIADIVIVMNKGNIMQIGTPEDIYSRPENIFVAEFIGDSTIIDATIVNETAVDLSGEVIAGLSVINESGKTINNGDSVKMVFRAADFKIYPENTELNLSSEDLLFTAHVETAMFIGSEYKHSIPFHGQTLFADWEHDFSNQNVKLVIPKSKVRVFH